MTITASADGSALGNPGPAGWAWYIDDDNWQAGGWPHATNNQGELTAVLELLRSTAHLDEDLHILCDSQYVINSITKWMPGWKAKGWRKGDGKPVMNLDLLQQLDAALVGRRYRFEWVKGHVGHDLNEAADARCRAVAEAYARKSPVIPTGPGFTRTPATTAIPLPAIEQPSRVDPISPVEPTSRVEPISRIEPISRVEPTSPVEPVETSSPDTAAPSFATNELIVFLTDDERARLESRARAAGVSSEDFVRGLI